MADVGLVQFANWDAQGGAPSYKAPGIITGGRISGGYDVALESGLGGQSRVPGMSRWGGSLDLVLTTDSKALLQKALRASYPAGALSEIMVKAGVGSTKDYLHENALISRMSVSAEIEGAARGSLEWIAKKETEAAAGGAAVAVASEAYAWHDAVVTIGGSPYQCQSVELSVENPIIPRSNLDTKAALSKRWPVELLVGREKVGVTVGVAAPLVWDTGADAPAGTVALVLTLTVGAASIIFTFSNLMYEGEREMPFVGDDGLVIYRYRLVGKEGALAIT